MIDLLLFAKILSKVDDRYISEDDIITEEVIKFFVNPDWSMARIEKLFEQVKNNEPSEYRYDVCCTDCNSIVRREGCKTSLINYIKYRRKIDKSPSWDWLCEKCETHRTEKQDEQHSKVAADAFANKEECTSDFINSVLNPCHSWDDGVSLYAQEQQVDRQLNASFRGLIVSHIKSMGYKDFLKTPYWKTIAARMRRRASYKCQLCGAEGKGLYVHHNSYDNHGYEDCYDVQKNDLIVLCKNCHEKHHNIEVA